MHGGEVEFRRSRESGDRVEVLRGQHGRLGAKAQTAQPVFFRVLDGGEQQLAPHALSLRLRGDGERADVRLGVILREFACRVERLQRDRPDEAVVRLVNGDKDRAVTAEPESPQRLRVLASVRQQSQCPVRRNS